MKRIFVAFVAVGLIAALAAPSFAAELKGDGAMKLKYIVTSEYGTGQSYPVKKIPTKRLTTMRANPRLQFIANEYTSFVWTGEIDVDWGSSSYTTDRGKGGALAADTTNLENKSLYLRFAIPETPVSFTGGLQPFWTLDGALTGTDMAAMVVRVDLDDTKITAAYSRWWDFDGNSIVDDVDFWHLYGTHKFGKTTTIGGFFSYLKDGSGHTAGQGVLQGNGSNNVAWLTRNSGMDTATRKELIPATATYDGDVYMLAVEGSGVLGPVKLQGWAMYEFGQYDIDNNVIKDIDVAGFSGTIIASSDIGPANVSGQFLYVQGNDDEDKFSHIGAGEYQLAGEFYYRPGMMILMCDGDDINNSAALAYNLSNIWENRTLGLIGGFVNARMKLPMNLSGKVGLGGLWSAEDRVANGETDMGYELNGSLTYAVAPNATIAFNAAYAWIGDFYKVSQRQADDYNAKVMNSDPKDNIRGTLSSNGQPDDIYYTALVFRVAM